MLNDTVVWAEYGHPGQSLPGVHVNLDDLPFQTDYSAGMHTRQHVTSLGWVRENVNGRLKNVVISGFLLQESYSQKFTQTGMGFCADYCGGIGFLHDDNVSLTELYLLFFQYVFLISPEMLYKSL